VLQETGVRAVLTAGAGQATVGQSAQWVVGGRLLGWPPDGAAALISTSGAFAVCGSPLHAWNDTSRQAAQPSTASVRKRRVIIEPIP
jgi:hypothetical protein